MLDLFSDLSLHFERYFILNEYSIHIIQWCVLGLFVLFITLPIWKEKKSDYVFYAGLVLRVVLLGGMTLEMSHQVLARQYTIETFEVLTDFMQFLIYGYVLLASLYYVISLPYLKNKGMFFAFDLSVLLLPLCQTVFILFAESKKFFLSGDTGLVWRDLITVVIMVGFAVLVLYLFFRLFWQQKWKESLLFYGLIFAALLYIFYPSITKYELQSSFKSIVILAAAAGSFMMIYLLCALLRDKVRLRQWGAGCIAVFFLLLLNPIVNIPHTMFQFTKTELVDTFSEEYRPLSAISAKELASKFVPADQKLYLNASSEPIPYQYVFAADQYEVNISAFTGELSGYSYRGRVEGKELTDKEYRKKTIEFFERSGRSIDLNRIQVVVKKEGGETSVLLLPKVKMSHNESESFAFATWKKGTLRQAQYGNAIFKLKDIDGINITETEIKNTINSLYQNLHLKPPVYQITGIDDFYLDWQHEVNVTTNDQSEFRFNGSTKDVINLKLSKSLLQQKKGEISDENLLKLIEKKPEDVKKKTGTNETKQYTFNRSSHLLRVFRDHDGIELRLEPVSFIPDAVSNKDRDEVYQQVLKSEKPSMIYKKQIKPVRMINEEGDMDISWLVIIQTFGSNERKIYEVNGRTKEVHRFDR
ncbi:7TM-DISM domain-containing protein [Bacillus pumilus]|uniref:hypothetical protein n=1 Tax=Bacillus TaxID=1386 RepID=UPI000D027452|nr:MULTISPECIES: hypothetical protein [Bacillus]MBU5259812.1 7TM-DISM domain-containing protein [Bacillus pumilus]MDF2001963.1 hypothetical protein [Bacillus pumilus]MDF2023218.1 hypothetical protein [Bacillus pumilus]MDF2026845.1 hypothetical protein [Bacillus pumilus]MDF2088028.1 hypothetical protein [Bacillus pumilus]